MIRLSIPAVLIVGFVSKMKRFGLKTFVTAGIIVTALGMAMLYGLRTNEYRSEEFLMDTLVSIRVYGRDTDQMRKAAAEAFDEMRRIHELTDRYAKPGTAAFLESDVCRINAGAGVRAIQVSDDVFKMLEIAKEYSTLTDGAFDITIGPVMDAWRFGQDEQRIPPSAEQLKDALTHVCSSNLILEKGNKTAFLAQAEMSLDLGAIAKGYATEKAAQTLIKHGINEALIDAGGNIRAVGKKDGKSPWSIGVQDPRNTSSLVAVLSLSEEAAVTSGDYNRFFTYEGKRYHHLISPHTGMPARENMSVTVIAKDAALADALSTSLFVLNADQAMEVIKRTEGAEVLMITSDGRIIISPGLINKIKVIPGEVYRYEQL